jgi:hypothetical protein
MDFDDIGFDNSIGANEDDGTEWGEFNNSSMCGTAYNGDAWFIWVRE